MPPRWAKARETTANTIPAPIRVKRFVDLVMARLRLSVRLRAGLLPHRTEAIANGPRHQGPTPGAYAPRRPGGVVAPAWFRVRWPHERTRGLIMSKRSTGKRAPAKQAAPGLIDWREFDPSW